MQTKSSIETQKGDNSPFLLRVRFFCLCENHMTKKRQGIWEKTHPSWGWLAPKSSILKKWIALDTNSLQNGLLNLTENPAKAFTNTASLVGTSPIKAFWNQQGQRSIVFSGIQFSNRFFTPRWWGWLFTPKKIPMKWNLTTHRLIPWFHEQMNIYPGLMIPWMDGFVYCKS